MRKWSKIGSRDLVNITLRKGRERELEKIEQINKQTYTIQTNKIFWQSIYQLTV
jgi:hypothetical protein